MGTQLDILGYPDRREYCYGRCVWRARVLAQLAQSHNHHCEPTMHSSSFQFSFTYNASQIFIIIGIVVNCGGNTSHHYIGGENWRLPGAPFVGGIGGFASVFVTASFACKWPISLELTREAS
jgi:hypothetical protein